MPFALGCITLYFAELRQQQPVSVWIMLPWLPVAGALAVISLFLLEGLICIVMFAPLALVLSTLPWRARPALGCGW